MYIQELESRRFSFARLPKLVQSTVDLIKHGLRNASQMDSEKLLLLDQSVYAYCAQHYPRDPAILQIKEMAQTEKHLPLPDLSDLEGIHTTNQDIERFIRDKDARGEVYTLEDIAYISQYEGSGGQASKGATGEGVLYEFYTPEFMVELMWELAYRHGYDDGFVLEPSIATGRLIKPAKDYSKCVGFEINPISARIAEITYPGATIHRGYFEAAFLQEPRFTKRYKSGHGAFERDTWLLQYPFSMVIGNPPYGIYKNQYSSYFPEGKRLKQIENFFMYMGLKMLKKGGLLIYLTSSNFMRNGDSYNTAKEEIAKLGDLVDAYRTPPVFASSKVPTDILIFRRK